MTLEVNTPPSFPPLLSSLLVYPSGHPLARSFLILCTNKRSQLITLRCRDHSPPALFLCRTISLAVWFSLVSSYRGKTGGGHHGVLEALGRNRLAQMMAGTGLVLSLPAPSCTPGPLDPGNISGQNIFISYIFILQGKLSCNELWSCLVGGVM